MLMIICTWKSQRMGTSNLKLMLISWTWGCTTFECKKKKNQKLAGLWLAGEVVNHVGIYGSKAAEGLSAFQRRSCFYYYAPNKYLEQYFLIISNKSKLIFRELKISPSQYSILIHWRIICLLIIALGSQMTMLFSHIVSAFVLKLYISKSPISPLTPCPVHFCPFPYVADH